MTTYSKGDLVLLNKSVQNWLSCKFGYICRVYEDTGSACIVTRQREVKEARHTYRVSLSQLSKPTERQLKHKANIQELERQNRL
jgi:hypothetical protein